MDSVTHIFLGGAVGQAIAGRRIGFARAFRLGAIAGSLPDLDALAYTGEVIRDHALHRHFMHALVMVPVLAFLTLVGFMVFSRTIRPAWRRVYLAALLACATHTLLDLCTSYGTMILWPFSFHRYALDIIAVVDPLYTLPLLIATIVAWRRRSLRPALVGLLLSCIYLGFATWQHARAVDAQRALSIARGVADAQNPRVLPQIGAVVCYRSIYLADGIIHADAIRVPYLGPPQYRVGHEVAQITAADLHPPLAENAARDFAICLDLSDGYLARSPDDPLLLADERYTFQPDGIQSVWGVQLELTRTPQFRITPRLNYIGGLLRETFRPRGYADLASTHVHAAQSTSTKSGNEEPQ